MADGSQLTQLTFAGGINEAVRDEALDPGVEFLVRENTRQPQRGVADKRYAFAARTRTRADATTRNAAYKLVSYNGVPCVIDGHQLDSWSVAAAADMPRARVPECSATRRPMASRQALMAPFGTRDAGDVSSAMLNDVAYANGYYVIVYVEQISATSLQLTGMVCDATTGEAISTKVIPSSNGVVSPSNVQVVAVGSNVVALWDDGGANIKASRISVATSSSITTGWAAAVTLASDLGQSFIFSACGMTTKAVLVYGNTNAATARVSIKSFDPTVNALTILQSTTAATANANLDSVSCDGVESDTLWIAWSNAVFNVICEARSPTNITTITGTSITTIATAGSTLRRLVIGVTGTAAACVATSSLDTTVATWNVTYTRIIGISGGAVTATGGNPNLIYGFLPASKPFAVGGRIYLEAFHDDTASTATVLFDVTTYTVAIRPVAMVAPRLQSVSVANLAARHCVQVSSTKFVTLQCIASSAVSSALCVVEHDFAATNRWQPVAGAGNLLLSGGIPVVFDGQSITELGFVVPPRVDVTSTGTGLTGTFNYTALYEGVDGSGNIVWSETAPVQTITVANKTVTVHVRALSATWRYGTDTTPLAPSGVRMVRIKIYRTQNGGGLFYLLTSIVNDPAVSVVTYSDTTADTALIAGAQPYTSPGVLGTAKPRQNPGSIKAWTEYNGMIVALSDSAMWWTPQHVDGEGIYFTDVCQQPFDQGTAVAAQDGTCFAFKRREIYAVAGEPPSDNCASGGLGAPRRLACDVGCIDPRSVVVTAKGIFFQSDRGIELLSRAQSVEYIGEKVRKTLASYPIITSATLDAKNSLVYFECVATETANVVGTNGVALVYDLARDQWESRDTRTSGAGTAQCAAQSAAYVYTGSAWAYAWLSSDGYVHVEDPTTYLDPGSTYVVKQVVSGNFKTQGMQGEQIVTRALLLANRVTAHDLSVSCAYDYSDSYKTPRAFTAAELSTITGSLPRMQVEIESHDDARCQAFRVKLLDATPTGGGAGTGQGSQWIGLTIESVPQPGPHQLPDMCR